ncbi:MAG: MBOAT family protein [Lachnospiraceae bacterium]|nr:MBOAT family protein [Lachnospiraceae bacterium]
MYFNSLQFIVFFPVVLLLYFILPGKLRKVWLLAASYYFYMCWEPEYVVLILFSTIATYAAGLLMEKFPKYKKKFLVSVLIMNLAILFFFKYFDFALANFNHLLGVLHIKAVSKPFDLLLPVGISFYTFQSLGYAIDVYRGEIKAEKNFLDYALFVSFFPQLVAGPIERSGNLLKQVKESGDKRLWTYDGIVSGLGLMLWGFFMKMCIADRASIFIDTVYANVHAVGTFETLAAMFGFAFQIYADFAGYSAIAIGAARMMGFTLMENFNCPHFAESIAEFWRRWHISLSGWFKDYLYIPLGGNRKGRIRKYINLMITFIVSGLWHGASWNYVFWGGLHGVYQVVGDILRPVREKILDLFKVDRDAFSFHLGRKIGTTTLVAFALIFFRARSMRLSFSLIKRMFTRFNPWVIFDESMFKWGLDRKEMGILLFGLLLLLAVSLVREIKKVDIGVYLLKQNLWFRWVVYIFLITAVLVWGEYGVDFDSAQFIYFNF